MVFSASVTRFQKQVCQETPGSEAPVPSSCEGSKRLAKPYIQPVSVYLPILAKLRQIQTRKGSWSLLIDRHSG